VEAEANWIEFRTLKDLFSFVITKSMPGQQVVSLMHYKDYTYTFSPINDSVMVFFTKEIPKASIYTWDSERDEYLPVAHADRSRLNILVQDVIDDTLIKSLFYKTAR
jgi:hypothetical protein